MASSSGSAAIAKKPVHVLFPMAGLGERFEKEAYSKPKPLVNVLGKPIIFWLLENLKLLPHDHVYFVYRHELERWRLEDHLRSHLQGRCHVHVHHLSRPTRGAAETVALGIEACSVPRNLPLLLLDCDTFYTPEAADVISLFRENPSNVTFVFEDQGTRPIYSYVNFKGSPEIVACLSPVPIDAIAEKRRISRWANTGAYGFASASELLINCRAALEDAALQVNGEFYTSSVIQRMLKLGAPFYSIKIPNHSFVCLGTPLQLRMFCSQGYRIEPQRIVFDLDRTLLSPPKVPGDYSTCVPYTATVDFVRFLKSQGHTIIINTARGMRSRGGNLGRIATEVAPCVYDSLKKWSIPADEVYFGKPYGHFYVDDLAVSAFADLDKELGFYRTAVAERDHNSITPSTVQTLVKRSEIPLWGEIHWYTNVPPSVRHLFPAFIRHSPDGKSYELERLAASPASYLYVNECLTEEHLKAILARIEDIHLSGWSTASPDGPGQVPTLEDFEAKAAELKAVGVDLAGNYAAKVQKRWDSYDYAQHAGASGLDASTLKDRILQGLALATESSAMKRRIAVVHGDPVLSNILLTDSIDFRFVDMRGKIDDVCTIWGDALYDWAKVYQSLTGYEEIQLNRRISARYSEHMIATFKAAFTDWCAKHSLGNLWPSLLWITASLYFTLIPLHHNEKCEQYLRCASDQAEEASNMG
jgi:capsule biosynthesis phosphatase